MDVVLVEDLILSEIALKIRVKLMKTTPSNGCWTCGGPHYERDCPENKTEAQS